ncbi:MAG: beta-mannanase [Verrucomicrobia bacterium]|nr:beta-mannanase [Verrucomicrobiota bacterium]
MAAFSTFTWMAAFCLAALSSTARSAEDSSAVGESRLAVPAHGAYTGAYIDFGETEDAVTLPAIEAFEQLVGKHQAIVASSSYWGRGNFPTENVQLIRAHGAIPLLYWSPWGPPYEQNRARRVSERDPFTLARIVAGECDDYIDRWADAAREFGAPLLVSFGNEMNADWFPWGGVNNGGKNDGAELFKTAWRHVVARARTRGANNIAWVFQANATSVPAKSWNTMAAYYPGAEWVDWLALSVYGQLTPGDGNEDWVPWTEAMDKAYAEICAVDPTRPVMLAEWGVGEFPRDGDKGEFIRQAFTRIARGDYPRIKAAVFWHERWQNKDESWSNLRVNSSPSALRAYRAGVADPFWLDRAAFTN